jgi:thiamine pyrophosphokinase
MKVTGTNITMTRGDSESITVSCKNAEGVAIPLVSGDKIYLTVKENMFTPIKKFQKIVTTFTGGNAVINIVPDDTKNLSYGTYKYDIQLTKANGNITTIVPASNFIIEGEVTYD